MKKMQKPAKKPARKEPGKPVAQPPQNRAILDNASRPYPGIAGSGILWVALALLLTLSASAQTTNALVVGNLLDVTGSGLTTAVTFTPTNQVYLTSGGIMAGSAKTITATNGVIAQTLAPGDYWLTLPLVSGKQPFKVSVPTGGGTLQLTNLMNNALTYVGPAPRSAVLWEEAGSAQGALNFEP